MHCWEFTRELCWMHPELWDFTAICCVIFPCTVSIWAAWKNTQARRLGTKGLETSFRPSHFSYFSLTAQSILVMEYFAELTKSLDFQEIQRPNGFTGWYMCKSSLVDRLLSLGILRGMQYLVLLKIYGCTISNVQRENRQRCLLRYQFWWWMDCLLDEQLLYVNVQTKCGSHVHQKLHSWGWNSS